MQWSKLRKKVESFLAGSVKGRVGFHFTQYRRVWYGDGRGWITIDKKQVTSMACLTAWKAFYQEAKALAAGNEAFYEDARRRLESSCASYYGKVLRELKEKDISQYRDYLERCCACLSGMRVLAPDDSAEDSDAVSQVQSNAKAALAEQGTFTEVDFLGALSEYINLTIDEILACENPIIRAVGMLDRRVGKRRLKTFDPEKEHSLVRTLLRFRLEAEGLASTEGGG